MATPRRVLNRSLQPSLLQTSTSRFSFTNQTFSNGRARVAATGGRQGVHAVPPPRERRAPGVGPRVPPILRRPPPPRRSPRSAWMLPSTHILLEDLLRNKGVERISVARLRCNWVRGCQQPPAGAGGCLIASRWSAARHVRRWSVRGVLKTFPSGESIARLMMTAWPCFVVIHIGMIPNEYRISRLGASLCSLVFC